MKIDVKKNIAGGRLRNKFIFLFILLACVPVLVLGGTTLYLVDAAHREDVSNLERQLLGQKAEEIDKFLANTLGVLRIQVSALVPEAAYLWEETILDELFESNPAFAEVRFIDLSGKESAKRSRYASRPALLHVDKLVSFQAAKQGHSYIGDIYLTAEGPMVTMAAPIFVNGVLVQVVSAEVDLSSVAASIESARLGNTGYMVMLDQSGVLVAGPNSSILPKGTRVSDWQRIAALMEGGVYSGLGEGDYYKSIFSQVPVIGGGIRMSETGWMLLVEWPIADANSVTQTIRNQILMVTLASILAVLLLAPVFANRLIRPIHELMRGAASVAKGDFKKTVEIQTQDELEDLGNAFNQMTQGLKRLQELKDEFVFIAAHELRTPVTAMKGYMSFILEGDAGPVSAKIRKFLTPVWESNERLVKLVDNILEVARSEAGRIAVTVAPVDLTGVVKEVLRQVEVLAREKNISLTYVPENTVPHVLADPDRVHEIMMNLVSNAIKYTAQSGSVSLSHQVKENRVITHVADNGAGMSQEAQKHMFEKFFRAEKTQDIKGTGLGLFITKELVQKMGGKIWFTSTQGKGTTFSFSLPEAET